jgi:hypothetical protein
LAQLAFGFVGRAFGVAALALGFAARAAIGG